MFKDDVFFISPGEFHQVGDLGNGLEFLSVFESVRSNLKANYEK